MHESMVGKLETRHVDMIETLADIERQQSEENTDTDNKTETGHIGTEKI